MKIKSWRDGGTLDMNGALRVLFWLYVLTIGNPDLIDAVISWIGRH